MSRCFLVHGAFDSNAGARLDKLFGIQVKATGWDVELFSYTSSKWVFLSAAEIGERLFNMVEPGDVVIAQCFGCTVTYEALLCGAPFSRAVFLNPNLDSNIVFPGGPLESISVWYAEGDMVLFGGSLMPFSAMGQMGMVGYKGSDPRVQVFKIEVKEGMRKHTALFDSASLFYRHGPKIVQHAVGAARPRPFIARDSSTG